MSGITSTGLISGIDTASLVDQLIAVESKPLTLVQNRVAVLQSQKAAFLEINSKILALQSAATKIGDNQTYKTKAVTSSNESVLTASASNSAAVGSYTFTVDRLVSTHQLISGGFADPDTTPLGAGTLTFESARARLTDDPRLARLNGGEGVQRGTIRITDRSGASSDIDLTRAANLSDVVTAINNTSGINVTAAIDGDHLTLTDNTGSTSTNLAVSEVGITNTAADLGILGNSSGTNTLTGAAINYIGEDTALATLNDGNGIRHLDTSAADFSIELNGSSFEVSLQNATSLGDVIDAINNHASNPGVTAAVAADGVSLELTGTGNITVAALNSSKAAADLGIEGSATNTLSGERLIASLGSRLIKNLNGGTGVATPGTIDITNRAGATTTIDLSAATSINDVINTINDAGAGVTASLNSAGNGLKITDNTGSIASNLIIADNSGTSAADFGIATDPAGVDEKTYTGANLNLRYINETTRLDTLNEGNGVASGKFTITDSAGVSSEVDLSQGDEVTIQDVINEINSRPTSVVATINDTGDGILLTDTAGGSARLTVTESGSTTARDLGLLGEDEDDDGVINGSFEKTIDVEATDTLEDIVEKINDGAVGATASIINDGSGVNAYRLNITSTNSGAAGQFIFDDGGVGIDTTTLVTGSDAVVLYGSSDPTQALLLTSSTNTLSNTISGVTIDLKGASESPVQISITANNSNVTSAAEGFVSSFNAVLDSLDKYDKYDSDTETKGLLLGDSTVATTRSRLFNIVLSKVNGVGGQYKYLTQVGIKIGEDARLEIDTEKFNAALANDPAAVLELFTSTSSTTETDVDLPDGVTIPGTSEKTLVNVGFGKILKQLTENLTNSVDGLLTNKSNSLDTQIELGNDRAEQLNELLGLKRARLEAQFAAMESALATLQTQQSALANLSSLAASG